jgi:hypothetical protein
MTTYTITLSQAEDKALQSVAVSAQEWIDNVVHERCRIAIDAIVAQLVQEKLAAGEPIVGTKEELVMAADIQTAAERQAILDAEVAAQNAE